MKLVFVVLLLQLLLLCRASSALQVAHLTDVHFDTFYGTSKAVPPCTHSTDPLWGLEGCDTSQALLESALKDASSQNPVMKIYTGDTIRHSMDGVFKNASAIGLQIIEEFVKLVIKYDDSTSQQYKKFGRALRHHHIFHPSTFFIAQGNHDFDNAKGVYYFNTTEGSESMKLLQSITDIFLKYEMLSQEEAVTFSKCAFYSRDVPNSKLTIVALNTMVWTSNCKPVPAVADPCGQLQWLNKTLQTAANAGRRVYIISHMPPQSNYHFVPLLTFKLLLEQFAPTIVAHFYGHYHHLFYGAMAKTNTVAPFFAGGSVTRDAFTTPTYTLYDIDDDWTITDVSQRYLLPSSWQWATTPTYTAAFNMTDVSTASLYKLAVALKTDTELFKKYFTYYEGGAVPAGRSCDAKCQRNLACRMICFTSIEMWVCENLS